MAARRIVEGWVFDVQEEPGGVGVWVVDGEGKTRKLRHDFKPYFFITGNWVSIKAALGRLEKLHAPVRLEHEEKKEFYSDRPMSCLKVSMESPSAYSRMIKALAAERKLPWDLYTCDIPVSQLFLIETGLFPTAKADFEIEEPGDIISSISIRDSPWETDYSLPPLEIMEIEMEGGGGNPSHRPMGRLVVKIDGREMIIDEDPLASLKRIVSRYDPHVIVSHWGDSYLMPRLQRLAAERGEPLPFGREASSRAPKKRGRSYFTYGKILFTASSCTFKGRWHLDLENSFTVRECGLEGLIELARLSKIPVQRMARTSTGTCISSMQVDRAIQDGYLIPWRKSQVEDFKTAEELLRIDKGGLTYRPAPGFYEQVAEYDFASMYPTLMAKFNLSPETVNCRCCPDAPVVPEAGFRVCSKRRGLIPKTISPLIEKRRRYKEKARESESPVLKEIYERRQSAHKWCLVTCFGYLGYKNARFGKIEAHESTTAWGREMLLRAKEAAEEKGFKFLHGLTDSLWVRKDGVGREEYLELEKLMEKKTAMPIVLEGIYRWISFLPSRQDPKIGVPARFVGLFDGGKLKVRGLMLRKHDTPGFVKKAQQEILEILRQAKNGEEYKEILRARVRPLIEACLDRLMNGRMDPEELAILKRLSRDPMEYEHGTMTAAVAQELVARGVRITAGEAIQMVVTDASAKDPALKARALGFLDLPHSYDRKKYREIFLQAVREIDLEGVLTGGRSPDGFRTEK